MIITDKAYFLYELGNACDVMPDFIFTEYYKKNVKAEEKCVYNLFAEAYKDVQSICLLMNNSCYTQAAIVLRTFIERSSKAIVIAKYDLKQEYIRINLEKEEHYKSGKNESTDLKKYFDYGFIESVADENKFNRDNLIKLVGGIDSVKGDIKEILNKFVHTNVSIFDFIGEKNNKAFISIEADRIIEILLALFQRLVVATHITIYNDYNVSLPVDGLYNYLLKNNEKLD